MDILENELVRKYFFDGCGDHFVSDQNYSCVHCVRRASVYILESMQQPIKKGERVLRLECHGVWNEIVANFDDCGFFHSSYLRLPDRFQKPECFHEGYKHRCLGCDELINTYGPPRL